MPNLFQNFIISTLVAFAATVLFTKISIPLFRKIGLVDDPKQHIHPGIIHTKPIPRGGGAPIFLGALLAGIFFLPFNNVTVAIFTAGLIMLIVGIIDDFQNARSRDVSPYLRFMVNILAAIMVVSAGVSISFVTNPFGGGLIYLDSIKLPIINMLASDFVSILWLIWVMNMVNWSKGVDGQMPGIVAISAIIIGVLSLRLNPGGIDTVYMDVTLSFIIAGAALGFLIFNFYPAKIFPGYGATSIYLLLGVISILSSAKLATAVLVMGIPTVDAVFTIIRRIMNKRSPFRHDNRHLHHNLLKLGYTQRQIALFYWLLSAILGVIALTLDAKSKVFALIMLTVITGGILVFLHFVIDDTK
jgi:UDP-GlcNAc:undecaprenyl-phosphate/decaprenyl-phosphate GlcNAc-1-phosphate transferase